MSLLKFKNGNAWQNLQLGTDNIANGAITSAKIADGTIVAGDIANGTITANKLASGVIPTFPKITVKTGTYTYKVQSSSQINIDVPMNTTMPNADYLLTVTISWDKAGTGRIPTRVVVHNRRTTAFHLQAGFGSCSDTAHIAWTAVCFS